MTKHGDNKIIFLDRDGILNKEIGNYVYRPADFQIPEDVPAGLSALKAAGYFLVVVTNQGGIEKGIYTRAQVNALHRQLQQKVGDLIDCFYHSPHNKMVTNSLLSKPGSLMLEKGLHKFKADSSTCWLIGDAERDLKAANQLGIRAILLPTLKEQESVFATYVAHSFREATEYIMAQNPG